MSVDVRELPVQPRLSSGLYLQFIIVIVLVGLADWLFFGHRIGVTHALFLVALAMASVCGNHIRIQRVQLPTALAVLLIAVLPGIESFSLLSFAFGSAGIVAFVLITHTRFNGDMLQRLAAIGVFSVLVPVRSVVDAARVGKKIRSRKKIAGHVPQLAVWAVPVVFSLIFLGLFAHANPLIEQWLSQFSLAALTDHIDVIRWGFWCLALILCWPFIRPRFVRHTVRRPATPALDQPSAEPGRVDLFGEPSVFRSLLLFNLLFGVQIGLDLTYLTAATGLPDGMTYAAYAHRGAYTLICTALMAAGFVLFVTRQGSDSAKSQRVRALVLVWTVQNFLLVIFCIQRLDLYIETYALTYWRVAAFVWMALVLIGLGLIIARDVLTRSNAWLVEMNLVSLGFVLYVTSFMNVAAIIAEYNVSTAVGPNKLRLDVVYLASLGADALPMMDQALANAGKIRVSRRRIGGMLATMEYLRDNRNRKARAARRNAANWRVWSWRNHRLQRYLDTAGAVGVPMRQEPKAL